MVQCTPVLFVKVTFYSVDVYGRGTVCYGELPMFLHRDFALFFWPLFFSNCLTIGYASFDEKKKKIDPVVFSLISINKHYWTISKKLFWPPFWNGTFFFLELWALIVHIYMAQISLQNSGGKVVFGGGGFHGNPPPWAPTWVKVPWSLKC